MAIIPKEILAAQQLDRCDDDDDPIELYQEPNFIDVPSPTTTTTDDVGRVVIAVPTLPDDDDDTARPNAA